MTTRRRKRDRQEGTGRSEREATPREASDPREDEGYDQPQSSAQKAPEWREPAPGHPE
jgi:hypothetical protein